MSPERTHSCPDCTAHSASDSVPATSTRLGLNRRQFVTAVGGAALATGLTGLPRLASAAPKADSPAEQAVGRFYKSLSDTQKKEICLTWDDPRRTKISANWHITKASIGTLTPEQQALVKEILKGITTPDGYERFLKQMQDDHGGIEKYAVAIAGTPGEGKSCFLLTGRHLTLRADGDTTENTAFGGPIVYGHGHDGADGNLFFYQTKRANEVFKALDAKQRPLALLARAPSEGAVQIRGTGERPGISVGALTSDQQELVKKVLADILGPYRKDDVDEALALVEAGGWDKVHMAFYQQGDIGDDGVWDIWRVEGPTLTCHFRGSPHVHAYINIAKA